MRLPSWGFAGEAIAESLSGTGVLDFYIKHFSFI
jgi:hypothetical protein